MGSCNRLSLPVGWALVTPVAYVPDGVEEGFEMLSH